MKPTILLLLSVLVALQFYVANAGYSRRQNYNDRYLSPDCRRYANGVALPDPNSRSRYYICRNGRATSRRCRSGKYFDSETLKCNFAALVDCPLNGRGEDDYESEESSNLIGIPTLSPSDETTCSPTTTTCAPTSSTTTKKTTTTKATTTKATTTKTTTTKTTTTTCPPTTTTPCSPSTPTPCPTPSPSPTPCPENTPTPTPCPGNTPTPTPCPENTPSPTPCPGNTPTPTPCPGDTPTPAPCSEPTTTPCPEIEEPFLILQSQSDCTALDDGTFLLDARHCRRYYVCRRGRARHLKCRAGQWFDYKLKSCRNSAQVSNCPAQRN